MKDDIGERARQLTAKAYQDALDSGCTAMIIRDNKVIEVHPDGSEKFIKYAEPSHKALKNMKIPRN